MIFKYLIIELKMLVLHFDINDTITAFDKTDDLSPEIKCNIIIARSVFGHMVDNCWIMSTDPYDESGITYYDYIKQSNKNYKEITGSFTKNEGYKFHYLIEKMVNSMTTDFLFPSFIKVCSQYPNAKIVFRTFGSDGEKVLQEFSKEPVTKGFFIVNKLVLDNGTCFEGLSKINDFLKSTPNPLFIQEDYHHWNYNGKSSQYGKQLLGATDFTQVFFDDNPCVNVIDNINAYFVKINTLRAMLESDYFLNKLKCLNL